MVEWDRGGTTGPRDLKTADVLSDDVLRESMEFYSHFAEGFAA